MLLDQSPIPKCLVFFIKVFMKTIKAICWWFFSKLFVIWQVGRKEVLTTSEFWTKVRPSMILKWIFLDTHYFQPLYCTVQFYWQNIFGENRKAPSPPQCPAMIIIEWKIPLFDLDFCDNIQAKKKMNVKSNCLLIIFNLFNFILIQSANLFY